MKPGDVVSSMGRGPSLGDYLGPGALLANGKGNGWLKVWAG